MGSPDRDRRYDDVKHCLAEADLAFARAGAVHDERERASLIEEAETWLVRAERRLARLTDRPISVARPQVAASEPRSFRAAPTPSGNSVWRKTPEA